MNKPRIAVIGLKGLPAFGGAATVGENIINHLKDNYDFYVYSISTHTENPGQFNGYNQIVFNETGRNGFATFRYYIKSLLHCLFKAKYDLVHLHHSESGFITPLLRLKYKVVVTFHAVYSNKLDPKFGKLVNKFFGLSEKLNMVFADGITSVSKADKDYCELRYKKPVIYIPNGINIIETNEDSSRLHDYIFVASRIYEIKGLHLVLNAMHANKITGRLIVIGDLNQVACYKKEICELAKGLDVEFVPLIKDKSKLYSYISKSKLFIFPSLYEAMSMTLLETVSLKTPVLASDIEANTNIFNSNEVTYFRSDNYKDLSEQMLFCRNNEHVLRQKAEAAYKKVMENYTWNKITLKYSEIFNNYLQ